MASGEWKTGQVVAGRFALEAPLGAGGYATVWLARDSVSGVQVALKMLHRAVMKEFRDLERFVQEAKLLMAFEHPRIARALAFEVKPEYAWVALEYVPGLSLREEIEARVLDRRWFTTAELLRLLVDVAGALDYVHSRNIVHRDLKPNNIICQKDPLAAKLLDFGIARVLDQEASSQTTQGRVLGTLLYLSPEQIRGARVGAASDLFAFGTMLFEMLTFRRTWARDENDDPVGFDQRLSLSEGVNHAIALCHRIMHSRRPRPSEYRPDLPPALDAVVGKSMAIDVADRFKSAGEIVRAVEEALSGRAATVRASIPAPLVEPQPVEAADHPDTVISPSGLDEGGGGTHSGVLAPRVYQHTLAEISPLLRPAILAGTRLGQASGRSPEVRSASEAPAVPEPRAFAPTSPIDLSPLSSRPSVLGSVPRFKPRRSVGARVTAGVVIAGAVAFAIFVGDRIRRADDDSGVRALPSPPAAVVASPGRPADPVPTAPSNAQAQAPAPVSLRPEATPPASEVARTPRRAAGSGSGPGRLLAEARAVPDDFSRVQKLARAIRDAAAKRPENARRSIERCVLTAEFATDLAALETCAAQLGR
jgi:serine/threonine-protein kinase